MRCGFPKAITIILRKIGFESMLAQHIVLILIRKVEYDSDKEQNISWTPHQPWYYNTTLWYV